MFSQRNKVHEKIFNRLHKKALEKNRDPKNVKTNTLMTKSNIEIMIDELKRLDDTLAPNKFPFENVSTSSRLKSTGTNNDLNVLDDLSNSLPQ